MTIKNKANGSFEDGPGLSSVKKGKSSGKTRTASVKSPSSLRSGTREGTGGSQGPAPSKSQNSSGGGYVPRYGKK